MCFLIEYVFIFLERGKVVAVLFDFVKVKNFIFEEFDFDIFFLFKIVYDCVKEGESYLIVFNAVNEEVVKYFLEGKIGFVDIMKYVVKIIEGYRL